MEKIIKYLVTIFVGILSIAVLWLLWMFLIEPIKQYIFLGAIIISIIAVIYLIGNFVRFVIFNK